MNKGPALTLALLMISFPGMAPSSSAGPSASPAGLSPANGAGQEILYTPVAEDAGAFFFRFHTENTACVRTDFNVTMEFFHPIPLARVAAHGVTQQVLGRGKVDILSGWGMSAYLDNDPRTSHVMINGSVVNYYNETGYDERSNRAFGRSISESCGSSTDATDRWVSLLITAPVRNATVRLSFFESWRYGDDGVSFNMTPGNATGSVTFSAESKRTFLKQLKDFRGSASANGDPLRHGAGPSAAAANVEITIPTTRGFVGGFLDFNPRPSQPEASLLSYQGPNGEAGAGSDAAPGSPVPKLLLLHITGSAGDWAFRAHAYAAPRSFSSLMVWGADIETGMPKPNLQRADTDGDDIPKAAAPTTCPLQNLRHLDGRCPSYSDHDSTLGLPNPPPTVTPQPSAAVAATGRPAFIPAAVGECHSGDRAQSCRLP